MTKTVQHYAVIAESDRCYQVYFRDEFLFESDRTLVLTEYHAGREFSPVVYFPELSNLSVTRTEHSSYCPIKGDATYWSFRDAENSIWSYLNPVQGVESIRGYYGFMPESGFRVVQKPDDEDNQLSLKENSL